MIHRHQRFLESLFFLLDFLLITASWFLSYYFRFFVTGPFPIEKGIPPFEFYLSLLFPIWLIWGIVFSFFGVYRFEHFTSVMAGIGRMLRASTFSFSILIVLTFFLRQYESSRLVFLYFWGFSTVVFLLLRLLWRISHDQDILIVGGGEIAEKLFQNLKKHPGIECFLVGVHQDIQAILVSQEVDQVVLALSDTEQHSLIPLLKVLEGEMVDVKVVPTVYRHMTVGGGIELFQGLPIITLQQSPLYGWGILFKRIFDFLFSFLILLFLLPLFLLIALVIKLTSRGPVFFKQKRMGLDGNLFDILKFRTMKVGEEEEPAFTKKNDPRRTALGAFLRRFSVDELPQFLNVLRGEMSIVGPRPERPELIQKFRKKVPQYMLRHRIKSGITGWAQINGWRGDTSVEKRLEYDLYYLSHWSFWWDLQIILRTLPSVFLGRNAY